MQFRANTKFLHFSPYKLRPIADVVRGKNVQTVLNWLATHAVQRTIPFKKLIESAAANARYLNSLELADLVVKEIRVDQGPIHKYFKPGPMGRSAPQRKRFSHMSVVLVSAVLDGTVKQRG